MFLFVVYVRQNKSYLDIFEALKTVHYGNDSCGSASMAELPRGSRKPLEDHPSHGHPPDGKKWISFASRESRGLDMGDIR